MSTFFESEARPRKKRFIDTYDGSSDYQDPDIDSNELERDSRRSGSSGGGTTYPPFPGFQEDYDDRYVTEGPWQTWTARGPQSWTTGAPPYEPTTSWESYSESITEQPFHEKVVPWFRRQWDKAGTFFRRQYDKASDVVG